MRRQISTLSAVAIADPIVLDRNQKDFKISLALVFSDTATASVETTSDDPEAVYPTDFNTDATWFPVLGLNAITTDAQGNVFFPISAVRLNVTAHTSGTVTLTVLQAND